MTDPRHIHLSEQAQASAADIGKMWAKYHQGMVNGGMERGEATKVLITWVAVTNVTGALRDIARDA